MSNIEGLWEEWEELSKEFEQLQAQNEKYLAKISEVKNEQKKCLAGTAHQRYRMKQLSDELKKHSKDTEVAIRARSHQIHEGMTERKFNIREIEESLPRKNGLYLSIVLGQVNVSLLSKEDKFAYKQDYERFKLIVTIISQLLSFFLYFVVRSRVMDAAFHFLLVWYYCTLTIREHILITNGSRIKGWWLIHHFISTGCAGILLIWPMSASYDAFRDQFMLFSLYLNFTQFIQYYYQRGSLYKLRALGESHSMDITVDGFMTWMSKSLSFLLPILFGAYAFQFYNAYTLYHLAQQPYCNEWQVPVLAVIFFVLFFGNLYTTLLVMRKKIGQVIRKKDTTKERMRRKYSFSPAPGKSPNKTN